MNSFEYKGYGRIFVASQEQIENAIQVLVEIDEFESNYLPDSIFSTKERDLIYVGKFNPDMDAWNKACMEKHGFEFTWQTMSAFDYEGGYD